ncbi:hypothetical protein Br6_04964 [Rhodococcus sp. Br-6]|nr:hypothetical protein Br6_04964 [Rhodococcus sp. Br-6]
MSEPTTNLTFGIDMEDPDVIETMAQAERQQEYVRRRDETLTQARKDRILAITKDRNAIDTAVSAYGPLVSSDVDEITVRQGFIQLTPPRARRDPDLKYDRSTDLKARPPLTKLINRPGNTLQVYLALLFIAQLETPRGASPSNRRDNNFRNGWAQLTGIKSADARQTNRRFGRALDRLADVGLVQVGPKGKRDRYGNFKIRKEDGSEEPYVVPNGGRLVSIPIGFFQQGWHLVLTANELAVYLIILNHTLRIGTRPGGIAIPQSVRETRYGLSEEAYRTAHELAEFGLVDLHMPEDTAGSTRGEDDNRVPLRFTHPPSAGHDFSRPAADVVLEALTDNSLPPRLSGATDFKGILL